MPIGFPDKDKVPVFQGDEVGVDPVSASSLFNPEQFGKVVRMHRGGVGTAEIRTRQMKRLTVRTEFRPVKMVHGNISIA